MSLISGADDEGGPRIQGWPDSGGVAVITWRRTGGQTYQQEIADEQAALHLLRTIDADDELVLISAQLRRVGTGPAS
jgi:hypothetical protein